MVLSSMRNHMLSNVAVWKLIFSTSFERQSKKKLARPKKMTFLIEIWTIVLVKIHKRARPLFLWHFNTFRLLLSFNLLVKTEWILIFLLLIAQTVKDFSHIIFNINLRLPQHFITNAYTYLFNYIHIEFIRTVLWLGPVLLQRPFFS